jgi:hypothetical protein
VPARKPITKKVRFEVFKRDSFKCQYCGAEAPNVLLEVDHIEPVAAGGSSDITNLVTACVACNAGKSDRLLSDDSAVTKAKRQLDELQQRRKQLELMMEWKTGLVDLSAETLNQVNDYFSKRMGYSAQTPGALAYLQKIIKTFSASEVIDAIEASIASYVQYNAAGQVTPESVQKIWNMIPGVCRVNRAAKDDPDLRQLYFIRGIMKKRWSYVNQWQAMQIMREARAGGMSIEQLRGLVIECHNWTEWTHAIESETQERD